MRAPAIQGLNTTNNMIKAGRFNVADPCTMATTVSACPPRRRTAFATGTIQAQHSVIGVPTINPFSVPRTPSAAEPSALRLGEQEDLRQARDREGEDHPDRHQLQVGEGEVPPTREQCRLRRQRDAVALEAEERQTRTAAARRGRGEFFILVGEGSRLCRRDGRRFVDILAHAVQLDARLNATKSPNSVSSRNRPIKRFLPRAVANIAPPRSKPRRPIPSRAGAGQRCHAVHRRGG